MGIFTGFCIFIKYIYDINWNYIHDELNCLK